ncbi:hypothetical protein CBL_06374 [Carabus blaptoides fortunei]
MIPICTSSLKNDTNIPTGGGDSMAQRRGRNHTSSTSLSQPLTSSSEVNFYKYQPRKLILAEFLVVTCLFMWPINNMLNVYYPYYTCTQGVSYILGGGGGS